MADSVEIDLREYAQVLIRRKWFIFYSIVFSFLIGLTYIILAAPVYRSTTQILIEQEKNRSVDFKDPYRFEVLGNDFYNTQYKILGSRFITRLIIEKNNYLDNPFINQRHKHYAAIFNSKDHKQETQIAMNNLIDDMLKNLHVEPIVGTHLVELSFDAPSALLAAEVTNAYVDTYIDQNYKTQAEALYRMTDYLQKGLEDQRHKFIASESELQSYKEKNNIISMTEKENIIIAKLIELNSDVLKAENQRIESETRYNQVKNATANSEVIESTLQVVGNPFINGLKSEEAKLLSELSDISKKYGEKHPRRLAIEEKLNSAREKLQQEMRKVVTLLKNEYQVATEKEKTLKRALEQAKREAQKLNKQAASYQVLSREVETDKGLFDTLLLRLKETGITSGIQSSFVKVIDRGEVPAAPVRPKKIVTLVLSLAIGIFLGIFSAFIAEYFDNVFHDEEELKREVEVPILGRIPDFKIFPELKNISLVTLKFPMLLPSEAFRTLRTSIIYSNPNWQNKTILVTSSLPSEGKSTLAANLAIIMAQNNLKVCLLDTDLRNPYVHKIFKIPMAPGITDYLVDQAPLNRVIHKSEAPNLDIITCGELPPDPAELVDSEKMKSTIDMLKKKYDLIIFDTAPVLLATEPLLLSTVVDKVIFIIKAGQTQKQAIRRSLERLHQIKSPLLGVVLNNIKFRGAGGAYGYEYGYGYGYRARSEKKLSIRQQIENLLPWKKNNNNSRLD